MISYQKNTVEKKYSVKPPKYQEMLFMERV